MALRPLGDSSPMGELPCLRNFWLCNACSNALISAIGVRLHRLLQRCHVTDYTCTPKQVVSLKTQQ
ncbi:hypothetical protein Taro_005596, partial [Colocasia esculenta]|nr:hypothetical protein [Colocasia esculenta]